MTARQRPQAFRELVTALYVHCVSFRGLVRLLALLGCGGAATLWRDVQAVAPSRAPNPQAKLPSWVEVDETWLSLGGVQRPVAVVTVTALQAVGIILVILLLITPAAAVLLVARTFEHVMILSTGLGVTAAVVGLYAFYHLK